MKALKQRIALIMLAGAVVASGIGYLALSFYHEFRILFASKPPKVLLASADDLQCRLADRSNENPNKLLFVSCSGFYDEE